jgi:hypothetical protein
LTLPVCLLASTQFKHGARPPFEIRNTSLDNRPENLAGIVVPNFSSLFETNAHVRPDLAYEKSKHADVGQATYRFTTAFDRKTAGSESFQRKTFHRTNRRFYEKDRTC